MTISLKHAFTSAVADGADTSVVRPSNWNAEHTITMATARILGRTTASTGAVEELTVGTGLTLSAGSLAASTNLQLWHAVTPSSYAALAGATFVGDVIVPDEAYGVGWNGSTEVPTKNAIYDKIETISGLSDGDKGDITVSSSGSVWTIDNDVVTYAKMQNVSAQYRLLGRSSSGAGDVEEVASSANVFTMLGSANNAAIRSNIGLGTAATQNTGTSGANVPLLNAANTFGDVTSVSKDQSGTGETSAQIIARGATDSNKILALGFDTTGNVGYLQATIFGTATASLRLQPNGSGVQVGSPTGGDKGTGTINTAGDIYKNNTAFTNPKWVLQHFHTGTVDQDGPHAPPIQYAGLPTLDEAEALVRRELELPLMLELPEGGAFARGDLLLASVEQAFLYIFQLHRRIADLEKKLRVQHS